MIPTTIERLHQALTARENCERSGNIEWHARWTERIDAILDGAPSGSGFDNGTTLLDWTTGRVRFTTAFHHMSEHGYYDGWTEHTVTVTPTFSGIAITVSGRDRNDIKDYIGQTFDAWLTELAVTA